MKSVALRKIVYEATYNPIIEYFNWINANRKKVSVKVYKVYKELVRIIYDPNSEWEYSAKDAIHAIEFVENYCKHSKGKMGGKPFILELWQKALVAATFGMVHKIDGTRKYQEVMLIVARKNGKSTLAAAIGLYLQIADGEPGAEIFAAATKKDQAKIIWLEAKRMVKKSKSLLKRIKPLVGEMVSDFNDSFFKPLGSDSDTLDGLNVHGALLDEIHAWTDKNLYDVIVDGTTAREQPLIFITTTAGTVRECVYDQKYDEAEKVINGYEDKDGYKNERFLPIVYELDSRDEWTDSECWYKANPGLGTIKRIDQLQLKVDKAKSNSSLIRNLLCKDFNIRETDSQAWLPFEVINNEETFDIADLFGSYCIAGVDLSNTLDITSATLLFVKGNRKFIYNHSWMPNENIEQRETEDKVPYMKFVDRGWLSLCEGHKVIYSDITRWFTNIVQKYDIRPLYIGNDPWNSQYLVQELKELGFELWDCRQGFKTLSPATKSFEADLRGKVVNYGNNGLLKWAMTNTVIKEDENENKRPVKGKNKRQRIDPCVASIIAYATLLEKLEEIQYVL